MYGLIKEEACRIRTNKETEGYINREKYCKIYKIPLTEMVWSC